MKKLIWTMSSYKQLKNFPEAARRKAGHELDQVQNGRILSDWKFMPSIGAGAIEIRIHDPHEHRMIYVAQYPEGIYVLHAFEKKSNKTPQKDIAIARAAYGEIKKNRK